MVLAIAGLVLQRHEDGVAGARPLPHQHQPADGDAPARTRASAAGRAARCRAHRDRRAGTTPDAPSATGADGDSPRSPARPAASTADARPAPAPACATRANSGRSSLSPARCSAFTAQSASRRLRPSELKASAWASFSSAFGGRPVRSQRSRTESKPRAADAFDCLAPVLGKAVDLAKTETNGVRRSECRRSCDEWRGCNGPAAVPALQRAIPVRMVHVDRPHLDAMLLRVAHELRGRVKTHRLAVEQRRREHVGVMAFDPGRGVDQIARSSRRGFRESRSSPKPSIWLQAIRRRISASIAAFAHALMKLVFESFDRRRRA